MIKLETKDFLILASLLFLSLVVRSINLTKLPIFCDEAIYVRWSQVMRTEPSLRFVPLQDGKQPLFMWMAIPFLKVFSDPLVAGRFLSVSASLGTLLGVIILSFIVSQRKRFAILAGLIYIFSPFALFFNRLALVDSLLSMFGIWSLVLSLIFIKTWRLDIAMILGFILGGALLTKSAGVFFIILFCLTVVLRLYFRLDIFKKLILVLVSLIIAFGLYNILRLGPNFYMIAIRNKDYLWSFHDLIKNPFIALWGNLKSIFNYYWHYGTFSLFVLGLVGMASEIYEFIKSKKLDKIIFSLFCWLFLPLLAQAFVAKHITARYILFTWPIFVFFVIQGFLKTLYYLKLNNIKILFFLILVPSLIFDYFLLTNPAKAGLPKDEYAGYLEDWTAGQGIKEISEYLKNLPKNQNIIVGTEGHFGTLPDGLQIYVEGEKNITVIGVGYPIKKIPESLLNAKKFGDKVFLVVNQSRFKVIKPEEKLTLVKEYPKPGGDKLLFFDIL